MLQYINWLWGGSKQVYNMDKLIRMIAVCKIENCYLAYKSRKRINEKKLNEISLYIENIIDENKSTQLSKDNLVTLNKNRNKNKKKNRNNRRK